MTRRLLILLLSAVTLFAGAPAIKKTEYTHGYCPKCSSKCTESDQCDSNPKCPKEDNGLPKDWPHYKCQKCKINWPNWQAWAYKEVPPEKFYQATSCPYLLINADGTKLRVFTGTSGDYAEATITYHGTAKPEKVLKILKPYLRKAKK